MPDIDFQRIELNLIPKKGDEPVIFYASQYETTRPFIADLMWGDTAFAPGDDCWAEIDIRKNDDNLVVITDDVSIDNNEVSVVLPVQALTCIGKNLGQVKIYAADDQLVAALNFILEVQPDPLAGGVTSETAIDNLREQIEEITQQVIGDDYYHKTEVDDLLDDKADKADTYTKTQVDNALSLKADASNVYTKSQTDTLLNAKANTADLATVATTGDYDDLLNKPDIEDMINDAILEFMPVNTETGPIASFTSPFAVPMVNVSCDIVATGGNGTPDNPIPINGYTGVNINFVDFNQQVNIIDGTTTESSVTITKSGGKLTTSGTATANINYLLNSFNAYSGHKYLIMNMDNSASFPTYYLLFKGDVGIYDVPKIVNLTSDITATFRLIINSGQMPDANFYPQIYDLTQMFGQIIADYIYTLETQTTGAGVAKFKEIFYKDYYAYTLGGTKVSVASVNNDDYPYASISWQDEAGTVYGGTLDVTRGKLHVDKFGFVADNSLVVSREGASGGVTVFEIVFANNDFPSGIDSTCVSSHFSRSIPSGTSGRLSQTTSEIWGAIDTSLLPTDDSAGVKAWLATNAVVFYYEITPVDIDLTPEVISAIVGENNVYNDTGDTIVQYKDSIQHYIDQRT